MKKIKLTQGKFALVDDEDFEYLNQWKWYANKDRYTFYAVRRDGNWRMRMHREVLKLKRSDVRVSDHVDHNGLNNQKCNLRIATIGQNCVNRYSMKNSTSKYKGVSIAGRSRNSWQAHVVKNGIQTYLGLFKTQEDAAIAYNKAAKKIHGKFAHLNIIQT